MIPVSQAIASVTADLAAVGASAAAEARTLVSFVLGVEPSRLALVDVLTADQERELRSLVQFRLSGKPLQYVTGQAFFRTISVQVGPGVFIPRPETEVLAGWAIDQVKQGCQSVVELCAGSGALTLSIAAESNPSAIWAVELSDEAYSYLEENLPPQLAEPGRPVLVPVHADMADALPYLDGAIDLVVANPPYIPLAGSANLPAEVRHDPPEALFSGPLGLDATAVVAATAWRLLKPGGVVGCEHGDDQAEAVRSVFSRVGFIQVDTHLDLTGRPRFVTARKPVVP